MRSTALALLLASLDACSALAAAALPPRTISAPACAAAGATPLARSAVGSWRTAAVDARSGASPTCVATSPELTGVVAPTGGAGAAAPDAPTPPHLKALQADQKGGARKSAAHGQPMVIGLSHKTATVEVREKLSIQEANWNAASAKLVEYPSLQEAAVLSTCNRFEVYVVAEDHYAAARDVFDFLKQHSGLSDAELRPNLFLLHDDDAVWHLLRVSAGLDSLVIGEGQILSQVKACYSHAIANESEDEPAGSAGKVLGRMLNSVVMAGKYVRSETEIAKGAVSISSAAVELAVIKSLADLNVPLSEARVAILGAGKMSRLLLTHLASHGVTKVTLLNRSRPRADELAAEYPELAIKVGLMDELWSTMAESNMVFTSTSATGCILTQENLEEHGYAARGAADPSVLIDISVPRNIESECNEVDGVRAYNVDDLKEVVARNQAKRRHKMLEAEVLLRVELQKFGAWQESLKYVPAIASLQAKYEQVRAAEVAKAMKKNLKGLSEKEREAVEVLTKGMLNKLLHAPMAYLRSDASENGKASLPQIQDLFQLGEKSGRGRGRR